MREAQLIGVAVLAVLAGGAAGWLSHRSPSRDEAAVVALKPISADTVVGGARESMGVPSADPKAQPDESHPLTYVWQGKEKEEAIRRVQQLNANDADYVCLLLGLLPRDEVFDKVNAKGRLTRYVERMRDSSELSDLQKALEQIKRHQVAR